VDDITLAGINKATIETFKQSFGKHVSFTDGGEIHWLLGIEIKRDRQKCTIMLRQKHYIENILKCFKLENEYTYQMPMLPGTQLRQITELTSEEVKQMEKIPYMNMVSALRYAADSTRPDIAYVTGQLARHLQKYTLEHYNAAKHCFQYLKGTSNYWLVLGGIEHHKLHGFTDTDSMATHGHKSILGYTFQFDTASISWSSKRGDLVPASVYEAEIQALYEGCKEAIWLKRFTNELLGISKEKLHPLLQQSSSNKNCEG
jgi:hypothetical protein